MSWQDEAKKASVGPVPLSLPSRMAWDISWKGLLKSGSLTLALTRPEGTSNGAKAICEAKTLGAVSRLYAYQQRLSLDFDAVNLSPSRLDSVEVTSVEKTVIHSRFTDDGVQSSSATEVFGRGETKEEREFKYRPVYDSVTALLYLRSQALKKGEVHRLLIHPFMTPYLLEAEVLGREVHCGRQAVKVSLGMQKIDRKSMTLRSYKKMKKKAYLWISDDAERLPLELRATMFIGDIRATWVGAPAT
jgi:hypothetical protein